jgi:hypothetical protein
MLWILIKILKTRSEHFLLLGYTVLALAILNLPCDFPHQLILHHAMILFAKSFPYI